MIKINPLLSINNNCNDTSSTFNESESEATDNDFHSLSSDDTLNIENSLDDDLRFWVTKHNISQNAINDILRIF